MKKLKIISILTLLYAFSQLHAQNRHVELDSLRSCLKTAKNDTVRVNLLNRMSYLVWNDGNKYDEALKYAVLAKSLSDSIDFKPGLAVSLRRIGIIYNGIGDYSKALDYLLHSLQINEYIKNNREIFLINGDIGLVYYNQKNLDDAIRFFLKSLQYNKNDGFTLQWIGTIYVAQGKYELGLKFLFLARNSYNNTKDISAVLNTIGTTFEQQGKIDSALSYYFKSLQISKNDLDQNCSDAYGGIGDIYFTQKSYKKSIEFELKSLYVARMIKYLYSVKETEKKLSQIYDSIGDCKKSFLHFRNYIMVRDSLFNDDAIKSTTRAEMNYQFDKKQMIENAIHDSEMKRQTMQRNGFICGFSLVLLFSLFIFRSYRKTKRQKNIISEQKKIVDEKK